MIGDMEDRMDRLDTKFFKFHRDQRVGLFNVRRLERLEPRMELHDMYECGSDIDEDVFFEADS